MTNDVKRSEGQEWYQFEFLKSTHWKEIRDEVYARQSCCQICGKRFDLQPHHLSYASRGRKDEWKDIRMLCSEHHEECHFISPLFKIPNKPEWLKARYLYVKYRYKVRLILEKIERYGRRRGIRI